jgi:hypothetical protein
MEINTDAKDVYSAIETQLDSLIKNKSLDIAALPQLFKIAYSAVTNKDHLTIEQKEQIVLDGIKEIFLTLNKTGIINNELLAVLNGGLAIFGPVIIKGIVAIYQDVEKVAKECELECSNCCTKLKKKVSASRKRRKVK